jgi:hypothetical protein
VGPAVLQPGLEFVQDSLINWTFFDASAEHKAMYGCPSSTRGPSLTARPTCLVIDRGVNP